MIGLTSATRLMKALGDETRLRILQLLSQEELSGSELMEILNMGQSRISTHLALLREVGLVTDRRAGRRAYYSIHAGSASSLWERALAESVKSPEFEADRDGLEALRRRRLDTSRSYFDRVAASFGEQSLPGRSWESLARGVLQLAPRARYADLGIGDGMLTLMLSEVALSVTAVDISTEMLSQLSSRAKAKGISNIETVEGEIEDLPLPDASHDVTILSQALHYAESPAQALGEAHRILVPGGRVLITELLAHTEEWVRDKLQHRHLGFTESQLESLLVEAGFRHFKVIRAARDPEPPHFMTLVATGTKS